MLLEHVVVNGYTQSQVTGRREHGFMMQALWLSNSWTCSSPVRKWPAEIVHLQMDEIYLTQVLYLESDVRDVHVLCHCKYT